VTTCLARARAQGAERIAADASRAAATAAAARDVACRQVASLLWDLARFRALEQGVLMSPEDVTPDLTSSPLAHTLRAEDPAAALRAAGVRVLGAGAYAVVVAAEMTVRRGVPGDTLSCTVPCAVKTLWHVLPAPSDGDAFARGVDASARLVHPNIVRTYGCVSGPPRCLVLEALSCSLADLTGPCVALREQALTHREAVDICVGLATGVAVLWDHRIVHGDLSLANVLLDGDMIAKVSDLGTARLIGRLGGRMPAVPVSGHYCAPERVARAASAPGGAPHAWDVYSLSVICMEVLTGGGAVEGGDAWHAALPRVRHVPLREALANAHMENAELRPSAGDVLDALRGAAATAQYTGCPPRRRIAMGGAGELRLV
jgi:hypothetical protein